VNKDRGVIFDFDGVLADSENLHLRAFQQVFGEQGWTLGETDYYARYLGSSDRDLVIDFARDRGLALDASRRDDLLAAKEAAYASILEAGEILYPAAAPVIERLAREFALAIASGSLSREIKDALRPKGLGAWFRAIVGADDVERGKPAPDPYVEAVRRLGLEAGRCVAIEDSPWGLQSARAAGLSTIAVTHTYPPERLADADAIVSSLDALTPAFIDALVRPSR
jgi:beta-phosphoglucomutase